MTKRIYMLTQPAFIGGVLLDAGSRITDDDLPVGHSVIKGHWEGEGDSRAWVGAVIDEDGPMIRSKPPKSSIEIDVDGHPIKRSDAREIARVAAMAQPANVPLMVPNLASPVPDPAFPAGPVPDPAGPLPGAHPGPVPPVTAPALSPAEVAKAAKAATEPKRRGPAKPLDLAKANEAK